MSKKNNTEHSSKKKYDINISKTNYQESKGFTSSSLEFTLSGKDMNCVIANTLRRISMDDIPTYAFAYIDIEYNNSVFNNDMMKIRLNQLPIYDINVPIYYLHPKYWQNVDYYDKNREKHKDEILVEGNVNIFNNTTEIMNVTTDHLAYYVEGEQKKYPHRNHPILLIQLRPGETFKAHLKGVLGIGERSNIWAAAAQTFYDEIDPETYTMTIESAGQMVEHDILIKAAKLVQIKLEGIRDDIQKRVDTKEIRDTQTIFFELVNEDHTIGNLINNRLQDHKDIMFSGVSKPDHLIKTMKFKISTIDEKKSPIGPLFETIDYLIGLFNELEAEFKTLRKKDIGSKFDD